MINNILIMLQYTMHCLLGQKQSKEERLICNLVATIQQAVNVESQARWPSLLQKTVKILDWDLGDLGSVPGSVIDLLCDLEQAT